MPALPDTPRRRLLTAAAIVAAVSLAHLAWVDSRQASEGRQLAALVRPGDLLMIASDSCGPCLAARRWLQEHGVAFSECSIERDTACRERFAALGAPGTPVMLVRGQPQLGFSPQRIGHALSRGAHGPR